MPLLLPMDTKVFLEAILPEGGEYYIYSGQKRLREHRASSIDDALNIIDSLAANHKDIYIGTGSFKPGTTREQKNVLAKSCLYIDVDVQSDPAKPKLYKSKEEAWSAIKDFLSAARKDCKLPLPTCIVDSGGGFHIYWFLSSAVKREQWQDVASALENYARYHGLEIDPITKDSSRILRVPGTHNWKSGTPRECKVIRTLGDPIAIGEMRKALPQPDDRVVPHGNVVMPANIADGGGLGKTSNFDPKFTKNIVEQCGVFKETLATGGRDDDYNQWRDKVHLLSFTEDGEDYVHEISKGHPDYNAVRVQRKWERAVSESASSYGPTTCERFAKHHPATCAACPHWNTGKFKSPVALGSLFKEREYPWPYENVEQNGEPFVAKRVSPEIGGETELKIVINGRLQNFSAFELFGDIMYSWEHQLGSVTNKVHIRSSETTNADILARELTRRNLPVQQSQKKHWVDFMGSFHEQLVKRKAITQAHPGMGWVTHGDKSGFRIAETTHWEDGTTVHTPVGDPHINQQFSVRGSFDKWKGMVEKALQAEHIETNVLIATAFATPLLRFLPIDGGIISATSMASGTGKSLALSLGQAVWGDPRHMMSLNDTTLSIFSRMGNLNNLPAYWDEVRLPEEKRMKANSVSMLYQITLGRERSRLTKNADHRHANTWETLLVCTSNHGLREHVQDVDQGMVAGMARVLEFEVAPLDASKACRAQEFVGIADHYGHAGVAFARWLVANHDTCKAEAEAVLLKLQAKLAVATEERFLVAMVTAIYLGARWAAAAGIVDLQPAKILRFLINALLENREETEEAKAESEDSEHSPLEYVANFLAANDDRVAVIKHGFRKGSNIHITHANILFRPDRDIVAVQSVEDASIGRPNTIVVPKFMLKNWLSAQNLRVPTKAFKQLFRIEKKAFPQLTPGRAGPRMLCWVIEETAATQVLFDEPTEESDPES